MESATRLIPESIKTRKRKPEAEKRQTATQIGLFKRERRMAQLPPNAPSPEDGVARLFREIASRSGPQAHNYSDTYIIRTNEERASTVWTLDVPKASTRDSFNFSAD